ncbi:hypothetical protein [Sediminibacillus albus]|uniref:Uncharacterized protein n=1 Tax=Sediminibacillus albus TaxID=407036 RepID=A0A1G8VNG7_9BACI|nr:hypothetical protein [Sediminibacillus albus]SDJ67616.1 hypothetical protein SAMN05216243_0239 [Sediminibacillus albus]
MPNWLDGTEGDKGNTHEVAMLTYRTEVKEADRHRELQLAESKAEATGLCQIGWTVPKEIIKTSLSLVLKARSVVLIIL